MNKLTQILKVIVPFVWSLAGVVASVDIILAEFFGIGSPPDDSFIYVLIFFSILASSSNTDDGKVYIKSGEVFEHFSKGIVVYPSYIAFLLFIITRMMSLF